MDKNAGYEIKQAVLFDNGRGIALGENATAPELFVTWRFADEGGKRDYFWGHYHDDKAVAEKDFSDRAADYQRQYGVKIVQIEAPGVYKYYSTQRPVDIGTFPKPPYNQPDEIVNFDQRIPVEDGAFLAWGYLTYTKPLTQKEAADYELRPAPRNKEIWREDTARRPIAEQMKDAAEQARREAAPTAPDRSAPDREGR